MADIIGVRFREAGKIYYFDSGGMQLDVGEYVVVETVRGVEVGRIVISPDQVLANENKEPLKPVLRVAERVDVEEMYANRERAKSDLNVVRTKVEEHGLPMRIVGGDYNLDRTQYTVYFTADERIDFRTLVRDLSSALDTRLQLLQVGDRDRAKLVGGVGRCGRHVCCNSWLTSFPSISIKMAKEQDLPLNPSKISGICGRLLCCLAYEYDQYRELRGNLPKVGAIVSTPTGDAKVVNLNTLRQTVVLQFLESMTYHELPVDELKLQYGLTVRPLDVQTVVEAPIHQAEAAQRRRGPNRPVDAAPESITAVQTILSPETPSAEAGDETAPADARPKRRRRRRKSRGNGSGNGSGGGESAEE